MCRRYVGRKKRYGTMSGLALTYDPALGFDRAMSAPLATERAEHKTIMVDAQANAMRPSEPAKYLKARRTASSLRVSSEDQKAVQWTAFPTDGGAGQIGRTKGGMNTKPHAGADAKRRPTGFFLSAGQLSGTTGAAVLLGSLPKAGWLPADRGYDADRFRHALKDRGIKVCIPAGSLARRR